MNEVYLMDRLNGQNSFCNIKTTRLFTQDIFSHKERHEITTRQKIHDKIKVLVVLKTIFQINNPLIFGFDEHLSLCFDVIDLIFVDHFSLFHSLDSDNLPCIDMPANSDLSERSSSNDGERIKVTRRYLLPLFTIKLRFLVQNVLFY